MLDRLRLRAFLTDEQYFHNAAPPAKIKTPGYDIKSAIATKSASSCPAFPLAWSQRRTGPLFTPANTPVLPSPPRTELVVFVGLVRPLKYDARNMSR